MFWFENETYPTFHAALLAEINATNIHADPSKKINMEWINSSYNNDACGSVMFQVDPDKETYVQLFAFETKADAELELGKEYGTQYSISICRNGEPTFDGWNGDDRDEAIVQAIRIAEKLLDFGFEHDGIHIVNIKEDSSGFPHKADDAVAEYRDTIATLALDSKPSDLDALCLFVQNCIGQTDGSYAGVFWSGDAYEEDSIKDIPLWKVQDYVEYEIISYFGEDK